MHNTVNTTGDTLWNKFDQYSDKRTRGWFMVDSPMGVTLATLGYLIMVWLGPKFMEKRKPFQIKALLIAYNFLVVIINIHIVKDFMLGISRLNYAYLCDPGRKDFHPEEMRIVGAFWCYFMSKILEFVDTLFFILRKKSNQMSFLHVYHHTTLLIYTWTGVKWYPSGTAIRLPMINSFIHVIMYSYYGASAMGPKVQKYLWWKKYITTLQLVQFVIGFSWSLHSLAKGCNHYAVIDVWNIFLMLSFVYLFGKFYSQSYIKKVKKVRKEGLQRTLYLLENSKENLGTEAINDALALCMIVIPILTYGALVWWKGTTKKKNYERETSSNSENSLCGYYGCPTHNSLRHTGNVSSSLSGVFIFASGGMSLAWSIGFTPEFANLNEFNSTYVHVCWYIAVIIGASISAVFINKLTRRVSYLIASILVVINGALFVLTGKNTTGIVIARYCDGIGFGLALIPTIVAGSEMSIKRYRGYVLGAEQLGLIAGMNIFLCISRSNSTQGIIALVFASLALIFTFMSTIESPLNHLRKGDETEAINALRMLQKPKLLTVETYGLLHENKQLLQEDSARGRHVNVSNGLIPLFKLCLFRAIVSMSLSFPLVWGFILASVLTNPDDAEWRFYIFAAMRLIGVIVAVYTLDTLGRKAVSVTSLLIGGGMLIGAGFCFWTKTDLLDLDPLNSAKGLLIGYQMFAGLAAPASSCYLGEAFSVSVKPYFVLVAVVFENSIQIISLGAFYGSFESVSVYGYVLGALQIIFGICLIFFMPETKDTTLQEALKKFSRQANVEVRL